MAHTDPHNPPPPPPSHGQLLPEEHPERHEHTDVPTRPLKIFFVVMLIVGLAVHAGLYWLFDAYNQAEHERDIRERTRSAVARTRQDKLPPAPRLQGVPSLSDNTPRQDAELMRLENETQLKRYGLAGDRTGATPPAMRAALDRGFKKNPAPATRPTTRPAANNNRSS